MTMLFVPPLVLALAAVLWLAPLASAAIYLVDAAAGNDANAGTTQAPWATVTRAMGLTPGGGPAGGAGPGDTVLVKNGTYFYDTTPSSSYDPCYSPSRDGLPGSPITFQAFPDHRPVLDCRQYTDPDGQGSPVFGAQSRGHIVYDGFSVPAGQKKNVMVTNSAFITLRNITIDHGPRSAALSGTGNYYCFFVNLSDDVTIHDSTCLDSYTAGAIDDPNAGGVVQFDSRRLHVFNNTFVNVGLCLEDKRGGQDNTWEFNYCVGTPGGRGFQSAAFTSDLCAPWNCSVQRITVNNNIFRGDGLIPGALSNGIDLLTTPPGTIPAQDNRDFTIHNNVIHRAESGFRITFPTPGVDFFNNIVVVPGSAISVVQRHGFGDGVQGYRPAPDLTSEWNCYQSESGAPLRFNASETGGAFLETFDDAGPAGWRSTAASDHPGVAYDNANDNAAHKTAEIPAGVVIFVGAFTVPNSPLDFVLAEDGPCHLIGNTSPEGTGLSIDTGAFDTARAPGRTGAAFAAAPMPPIRVRIRQPRS